MERWRRTDQKSAAAAAAVAAARRSQKSATVAQANYRWRRRGAIGVGL